MLDDLKIAQLFIRNRDSRSGRQPLTLAASGGDAYTLAIRFQELDPQVKVLAPESASILNWATLVGQGQEQWPIAFLMPSGAMIPLESK
jgi:hypothetical protein